jgi:hypothetical protein
VLDEWIPRRDPPLSGSSYSWEEAGIHELQHHVAMALASRLYSEDCT